MGCAETIQLNSPDNASDSARYFQRQYIFPSAHFSKYSQVFVHDVILKDMENAYKYDPADLKQLSDQFKQELETHLAQVFEVTHSHFLPDPQTLVVEPKILMIGTPRRVLNAVTTIAVFMPLTSGSAAFEARLTDGMTGELVADISDQRTMEMDLKSLTLGNFQKFTHAEAAFKNWAKLLAEMLSNKKRYAKT